MRRRPSVLFISCHWPTTRRHLVAGLPTACRPTAAYGLPARDLAFPAEAALEVLSLRMVMRRWGRKGKWISCSMRDFCSGQQADSRRPSSSNTHDRTGAEVGKRTQGLVRKACGQGWCARGALWSLSWKSPKRPGSIQAIKIFLSSGK